MSTEDWLCGALHTFVILGCGLIDNCAMLQAPKIKHSHTAICPTANEHIDTIRTKSNIKDLFIMSNQLRLGRQRWNIPYSASCVYA
jgi:hypothetical protein